MHPVIERQLGTTDGEEAPGLFVVWFDVNCGNGVPRWWWEQPGPQPLADALELSAQMRRRGWPTQVWPAHMNPRPDGRWDNPTY